MPKAEAEATTAASYRNFDFRRLETALAAANARLAQTTTDAEADPIADEINRYLKKLYATPPQSLSDAIIKLRASADPETGMSAGPRIDEPASIRQVLALLEGMAGGGAGDLIAALAVELGAAIELHNSYDVGGSRHKGTSADRTNMAKALARIEVLKRAILALPPTSLADCLAQIRIIPGLSDAAANSEDFDDDDFRLVGAASEGIAIFLEQLLEIDRETWGGKFFLGASDVVAPATTVIQRETSDDETIVDEREKNDLDLLTGEPILAPLAREVFEVAEEQGNMRGGPAGPGAARWKELEKRYNAADDAINRTHAETIGGVAWRLDQVLRVLENEDVSVWMVDTLRMAFEDAKRLHQLGAVAEPAGGVADIKAGRTGATRRKAAA